MKFYRPETLVPPRPIQPIERFLLNGSTKDMAVNGSVTPVLYSAAPTGSDIWIIKSMSLFIFASGTVDPKEFGDIAALTQGFLLSCQSAGVGYNIFNLQDNIDISNVFSDQNFTPARGSGWLNNVDLVRAVLKFPAPITLRAANGDFIRATVRDNLTGIDELRMSVSGFREVP